MSNLDEDEILSDLFGSESSDDFVPPTSSDDSSIEDELPNRKRKKKTSLLCRKKLYLGDKTENTTNPQNSRPGPDVVGNGSMVDETLEVVIENHNRPEAEVTPKKNVRKRISNSSKWKCTKRKKAHQSGHEYTNRRGKVVSKKPVKSTKDCLINCKYGCQKKITNDERTEIFLSYYDLPTSTEKRHFIINTTTRSLTARPKRCTVEEASANESDDVEQANHAQSRRKYTFFYFFNVKGEKVQVCKQFYLGTLAISQKPVYTAHATKNILTNTPTSDLRGKSDSSRRKCSGDENFAREHIRSFPTIESHYCRATTNRLYLGAHLSVGKMIELYNEKCNENGIEAVKGSLYRKIFNTEFNLGFHIPKSDRCDLCEAYKVATQVGNVTDDMKTNYERHITLKNEMRRSRKTEKGNKSLPVLLFDLQNVILTPHSQISSLFYLRKLNIYNLTAYYSVTKKVYCALWNETIGGRSGNDLASAVRKILEIVVEENEVTELITWSDSCVPQNKNSMMSNAILDFLREHPEMKSITMKYSLPGHSCVQEVDNAHSQIEKAMNKTDFFSPIGLIRILKSVSRYNPYRVIQMKPCDFMNFAETAKLFNYKSVPYTQVSVIKYTQSLTEILFKSSHDSFEPFNCSNIKFMETPRQRKKENKISCSPPALQVKPKVLKCSKVVSDEKKKDIKNAYPYMPLVDREFYNVIFK